jgi:hypothetical protein
LDAYDRGRHGLDADLFSGCNGNGLPALQGRLSAGRPGDPDGSVETTNVIVFASLDGHHLIFRDVNPAWFEQAAFQFHSHDAAPFCLDDRSVLSFIGKLAFGLKMVTILSHPPS